MFTAVQEDGDSLITFHEGPDQRGRVLAFWFRASGNLLTANGRPLARTGDMDTAARAVSRYRKALLP